MVWKEKAKSPGVKRRFRLTKTSEFQRVRRFGKSYAHPLLVLVALQNEQEQTRLGVTAGRTVGSAVKRNRAKRLIRAAVQAYLPRLAHGWDLVWIARNPLADAGFSQAQAAVTQLLHRARLIEEEKQEKHDPSP